MKRDLRFETVYPYPPERVWRALTNHEELAQWLMDNDFELEVGRKFQFHTKPRPGFDGTVHCEVVEMEEPRRLAYKWAGESLNTVVRFSLEPAEDGGTRLVLEHNGFEGMGGMMISALLRWNRMLREKLPEVMKAGAMGSSVSASQQYNFDTMANLIDRYERGATAFAALIESIPASLLDVAAAADEWSVHQTALHIVDAEIVGAARLRMIAAQPGATLTAYAGDIWGRELAYAKQPLGPAVELFQLLRRTTTAMLRLIPASAWANRAEHEEAGEVTLESYLDSHCEHTESHIEEIESLLKKLTSEAVPVVSE